MFVYDHTLNPKICTAVVNGKEGYAIQVPDGSDYSGVSDCTDDLGTENWEGPSIYFESYVRLSEWVQSLYHSLGSMPPEGLKK